MNPTARMVCRGVLLSLGLLASTVVANTDGLTSRQAGIVPIAAFTATGDLAKLNPALNKGLDAGLTINEIKEVLVQMYAYAGFPRSLNAINSFNDVVKQRKQQGKKDSVGTEANPLPASKSALELGGEIRTRLTGSTAVAEYARFVPVIDEFLRAHLFGDIFGRDNLDFQSREIATIAALAALGGVDPQLKSHFNVGLNVGLSSAQLRNVVATIETKVDKTKAHNAGRVLEDALRGRAAQQGSASASTSAISTASQPGRSQEGVGASSSTPKAEQAIIDLSSQKWRWMAERNVDALAELFHENAVFVHMGGTMTREQEIDVIRSGRIQYQHAEIQETSVKIIGSTAILLNKIRLVAVVGGNEVTNPFVVTEVYVQQGTEWHLGSMSFTRLLTP